MNEKKKAGDPAREEELVNARLLRLAHMFDPHRDNPLMRELCRLAIKCAREGLTHG